MIEDYYEYQVEIDGINYGMDSLMDVHIIKPLFDKFSVGCACSAEMEVKYLIDINPFRGAKLVPRYRIQGSKDPWKQIGVFYIDERKESGLARTLICYDSMMRANIQFQLEGDVDEWPRDMKTIVKQIATIMDIEIDPRTELNSNYFVEYPNEETCRDILCYVAAAHAGNWIITSEDKLLLVPLFVKQPTNKYYLVTENHVPITIGGVQIYYEQ